MRRRDFLKRSVVAGAAGLVARPELAVANPESPCSGRFPDVKGVTKYVAEFTVNTKYSDIPAEAIELGKKSWSGTMTLLCLRLQLTG
jgi:hypothetical protein